MNLNEKNLKVGLQFFDGLGVQSLVHNGRLLRGDLGAHVDCPRYQHCRVSTAGVNTPCTLLLSPAPPCPLPTSLLE